MSKTEEMENRRMPIMRVHSAIDGFVAKVISGSIAEATFDASTCHPTRESFVVMTTTRSRSMGGATKLTGPDHESILEKVQL